MKSYEQSTPWIGIFLVALGALFFLDTFYIIDFDNIFELWPLALVVVGVNKIRSGERNSGVILSAIGMFLLCYNLVRLPWYIEENFWAFMFIAGGFYFIFRSKNEPTVHETDFDSSTYSDARIKQSFVFGGSEQQYTSQHISGGKIDAVFGGGTVDLRSANLDRDMVRLEINCVFGGVTIYVPEHIDVNINISPLFGSVDDMRIPPRDYDIERKTLVLEGTCIFSGIEIKTR